MQPIGKEGVFWIPEHFAHVGGVFSAGVKVRVIANPSGEVHFDLRDRT
jgi:hypothetical protein